MSIIKACIFDLDGVIVETSHFHYLAWKRLAEFLDIPFSESDNEQLKGVSRKGSLQRILKLGNRSLEEDTFKEMTTKKNNWYLEYLQNMGPSDALPGVVPFIEEVRNRGIKTALASSSKNARKIISKLELDQHFDTMKDGMDVHLAKPNPEIFLKAAEAVGISPENCVVFEDAIAGIQAAQAANMRTVGVGDPLFLKDADYIIPSFENFNLSLFKSKFDEIPTL